MTRTQRIVAILTTFLIVVIPTAARAQAFADLKSALLDYSKADFEPGKPCEALGKFTSKDISQITAAVVTASATAPAHCRVSGLLSPEIAFEISLPSKWN